MIVKTVTGANAILKINGKPVAFANSTPYELKQCVCRNVRLPLWSAARHHTNLINFLHKLLLH